MPSAIRRRSKQSHRCQGNEAVAADAIAVVAVRNHCHLRRALHILSTALITAGIVVAVDVAMTLAWKEPVSTIYGSIQQGKASDSLDALEQRFLDRADVDTTADVLSPQRARELARIFEQEVRTGEGIGRIEIPSIDLETVVVEGTDTASLRKGPGHYPDYRFPRPGPHDRDRRAPDHLPGAVSKDQRDRRRRRDHARDALWQHSPTRSKDTRSSIPLQVEIIRDVGYERLVLTACHPLYSAAQRWAVFARITDVSGAGSGNRG